MILRVGPKGALRFVDRAGDVRAAARNDSGVERVERFAEGVVIEGHAGIAETRSPAKAIRPTRSPSSLLTRSLTASLARVRRSGFTSCVEHALGRVHGEQDVDAAALHFLPTKTRLRPRQRDEETGDAEQQKARVSAFRRPAENERGQLLRADGATRSRSAPRVAARRSGA